MTTKPVDFSHSPVNPFLAGAALAQFGEAQPARDVADDAPEGSYTYAIVQSAPSLAADECESAAEAVEVVVRWGTSVLKVAHLSPPRSFWLGESSEGAACDVTMPAERLGATRVPVVLVGASGETLLVVPEGARGTLTKPGQKAMPIAEALTRGGAISCSEAPTAKTIPLTHGVRAELEIGGLSVSIGAVNAGKRVAGRFSLDGEALPHTALSLFVHGALLAATALFMPPLAMADEGSVSSEQAYMIQQALDASAMREPEQRENPKAEDEKPGSEGGSGQRAANEEGKMGSLTSTATNHRYSVKGDPSNTDLTLARYQALKDAGDFGMVGILASMNGSAAPTAVWGREVAVGKDVESNVGNMWGADIGEAGGAGGLGLTGIGEGGGCRSGSCMGVGLGNVGTLGNGGGLGDGQGFGPGGGFGHSHGRLTDPHKVAIPTMRTIGTSVSGRLPPEVIQRVVRQNFGRFRLCYENGLRAQPSLQGRVAVRFVIGRDGAVSNVANGGSDLPDSAVVSCVTRAFYGLSFPQPDSGVVTVTYPIIFSPGT